MGSEIFTIALIILGIIAYLTLLVMTIIKRKKIKYKRTIGIILSIMIPLITLISANSGNENPMLVIPGILPFIFILLPFNYVVYLFLAYSASLIVFIQISQERFRGFNELIFISFVILSISFLILFFQSIFSRSKPFFKISYLVSSLTFMVLFFVIPLIYTKIRYSGILDLGIILLIIFTFYLIFTIPNQNYFNWHRKQKSDFIGFIIIPLFCLWVFYSIHFINPNFLWTGSEFSQTEVYFNMEDYKLFSD